jgi:hypothetical protein
MPLEESYWESMKSGVADMFNTGGRPGGAITAALFLKQVLIVIKIDLIKLSLQIQHLQQRLSNAAFKHCCVEGGFV